MDEKLTDIIASIEELHLGTYGEDFLFTWEKSDADLRGVALVAKALKELHRQGKSFRVFDTGLAVSIFRDKSTRTRFSFASAANALGLGVADLDEEKSQIAHGETVRETANMISFLTEAIGIRDDMFLGEGNRYMREVAASVTEGFERGVLARRPTLVNLQCDVDHPTQSMADLLALEERFGSFEALRGKKIAMTWAYSPSYGKPLSVPQGVIGLMTRFGMRVSLAHPEGYDLLPEVEAVARENAAASGGSFEKSHSMEAAFEGADVVYPKSWAPFSVMQRRTELLKGGDRAGLAELERECLARNADFRAWECDRMMMELTNEGKALYMHCLPADITDVSCDSGEVSQEVFEQYRLDTYGEAGWKPFVIAAMIFASKLKDPALALARIAARDRDALSLA
jgi:knotted carbamoyltransferase YgeW